MLAIVKTTSAMTASALASVAARLRPMKRRMR
jgi:hypothetical protein